MPTTSRPLTDSEKQLTRSIFGDAIALDDVMVHHRKWWWFQPPEWTMAPFGSLWFHPDAPHYRDCFGQADIALQAHFIHEMTHVWQHQQGIFLPLARHPFCRYRYRIDGRRFGLYGIEQQAEIVRHAFLMRQGYCTEGAPPLATCEAILPFTPA